MKYKLKFQFVSQLDMSVVHIISIHLYTITMPIDTSLHLLHALFIISRASTGSDGQYVSRRRPNPLWSTSGKVQSTEMLRPATQSNKLRTHQKRDQRIQ